MLRTVCLESPNLSDIHVSIIITHVYIGQCLTVCLRCATYFYKTRENIISADASYW
jgi:hypothetical protein